jgi:hypothetical protein
MNRVFAIPRHFSTLAWRGARFAAVPPAWVCPTRRRATRSLLAFLAFTLLIHGGFSLWLDYGPPRLRDPEYGKRLARLKARRAEQPNRPLILALGSSRVAMDIRPGVLEPAPDRPMLFNFALAGSGPIMELMAFRRALADGIRPDAVLIEYWPAFLREDAGYHEDARLDIARLRPVDRQLVREFFRDPDKTERRMDRHRLNPWFEHRKSLMNQASPGWLPLGLRNEATWEKIDAWGWLPGHESATPAQRKAGLAASAGYYVPLFAKYEISPDADRALRQLVAECRERDIPVALVYLPESAAFRSFMPPRAVKLADEHLASIRTELSLPLIDTRGWVPDDALPDGFHMIRSTAATFTAKLAPVVFETFPQLR